MKYSADKRGREIPAFLLLCFTCMASRSELLLCGQHESVHGLWATPACYELSADLPSCVVGLGERWQIGRESRGYKLSWWNLDTAGWARGGWTEREGTLGKEFPGTASQGHIGHWCFVALKVAEVGLVIHSVGKKRLKGLLVSRTALFAGGFSDFSSGRLQDQSCVRYIYVLGGLTWPQPWGRIFRCSFFEWQIEPARTLSQMCCQAG